MSGFSVRKPFTVLALVVIIIALGLVSFRSMKPELLPNIDLPYIITVTSYPGATAEQVEAEVTRPLESSFASLEALKSIDSQSNSNYSLVIMEFSEGADLNAASLDILQKVNQVDGTWSDTIGAPVIVKMNPNMLPVMIATVEMKDTDITGLSRFMDETLQTKLEGIEGVASLDVSGMRREQVNVMIRADKIKQINEEMAASIKADIGDKEQELKDTKADLESQLNDLKAKNKELEQNIKAFAQKAGEGSAKLSEGWAEWNIAVAENLAQLEAGLKEMKGQLAAVEKQQANDTKAAVAIAVAEAQARKGGVPLTDEEKESITVQVTAEVEARYAPLKKKLNDGITKTEKGIEEMKGAGKTLAESQGKLDTMTIETQTTLVSASAALAVAQGQITSGIAQVDQGLDQFEDALETALKQADMSSALTMATVSSILKAQNFSMPAGMVKEGNTDYLVRVGDEVASIEELQDMVLLDTGMDGVGNIKLNEVADVFMSDNLSDLYAKVNGHDGVLLMFSKQSEWNTTEVTDAITAKFDELSNQYPDLKFTALMNQGDYIYQVINAITSDLLWGALFAMLILLLFLRDIRPTLVTLCAIPISLVFALTAMYFTGVSINILSLGGLAVAIGRLVDDSIVVMENIFRLKSKGYSAIKAAVTGASQVAGAVTSSTLTTICVFAPLAFVEGLTKQLFRDFALTFAYALLASLVVAMTLVPTIASGFFRNMQPKPHNWLARFLGLYDRALMWVMRYKAIALIFVFVMLAVSVFSVTAKGFAYMPEGGSDQISVSLTVSKNVDQDERAKKADEAMAKISAIDGVDTVGMMSGSGLGGSGGGLGVFFGSGGGSESLLDFSTYVLLKPGSDVEGITSKIEKSLEPLAPDLSAEVQNSMSSMSLGGSGITVNIYSDDNEDIINASKTVSEAMSNVAGVEDIDDGLDETTPEIRFTVDRAKASKYGLTTAQVFQQVNAALTKENNSTQVTFDNKSYDVVLVNEHSESGDLTPAYIESLDFNVTQKDGAVENVKLNKIATTGAAVALPGVQRSDQRRYLPVSATVGENHNVTLVTQAVEKKLAALSLPAGVTYEIEGENQEIMDAFAQLTLMVVLGMLLVYLIMVAQFQSLKSPFIILFTIPLAFTGGFFALLISGMVLSVISFIGFAMLVGVIVANGIVLVDCINRLRLEGMDRVSAIREGAAMRMRPILMTALTTIFALLVIAIGIGDGTEMMQPLAVVCIGGLVYGTFMTLFVVPIIYDIFAKKELRKISDDDLTVGSD